MQDNMHAPSPFFPYQLLVRVHSASDLSEKFKPDAGEGVASASTCYVVLGRTHAPHDRYLFWLCKMSGNSFISKICSLLLLQCLRGKLM